MGARGFPALATALVLSGFAAGPETPRALGATVDRCDPIRVALAPTAAAPGALAYMELTMAAAPFGVAVSPDGRYVYDVTVGVERLRRRAGETYVVWAATPELDRVRKLGILEESGAVQGRVEYNKFLVFVTAEASADLDRWEGRILLTGLSPSGLMHTMRGHGIFEAHGVGC